jgi:hypothetical protein
LKDETSTVVEAGSTARRKNFDGLFIEPVVYLGFSVTLTTTPPVKENFFPLVLIVESGP